MQVGLRLRNELIEGLGSHHSIGAEVAKFLPQFAPCDQDAVGIRIAEEDRPDRPLGPNVVTRAVDEV